MPLNGNRGEKVAKRVKGVARKAVETVARKAKDRRSAYVMNTMAITAQNCAKIRGGANYGLTPTLSGDLHHAARATISVVAPHVFFPNQRKETRQ